MQKYELSAAGRIIGLQIVCPRLQKSRSRRLKRKNRVSFSVKRVTRESSQHPIFARAQQACPRNGRTRPTRRTYMQPACPPAHSPIRKYGDIAMNMQKTIVSNTTLDLKSVGECNRCLHTETLHPQATLISLEHPGLACDAVKFEFYAILVIEECPGGCACCGRRYYDFGCATMVFLTPGEIFRMTEAHTLPDKGRLLAFHPDLLSRTSLHSYLHSYTFFLYRKEEALHLSQRETATIDCCLENIGEELHHPIDTHTGTILSRHIQLLLDYCSRFYERQFITRENKNNDLMAGLCTLVDDAISSGRLHEDAPLPTAAMAAGLNLSEAYMADLLKFETGMTLAEYVRLRRLELARHMLLTTDATPAAVARRMGFASTQRFSALFKKLTGTAPADYRLTRN